MTRVGWGGENEMAYEKHERWIIWGKVANFNGENMGKWLTIDKLIFIYLK
jgi:hypothetical protein